MTKYNIQNYVRYKKEIDKLSRKLENKDWSECDRDELIIKFLPLVENLARKFSTSQQASGVMDITDLIQEGAAGLTHAVDRIDREMLLLSEDQMKTLKSFYLRELKALLEEV